MVSAPLPEAQVTAVPRPRSVAPLAGVAAVLAVGVIGAVVMLRAPTRDIDSKGADARPGATGAPARSASVPPSASTRTPPLAGMVALPGGAAVLGTPEADQAAALERCKSELAIEARDCTAVRLAREAPHSMELRAYDLDALEVDNASFLSWAQKELASGKAQLDAKGVVQAEGVPIVQTGTQHAGIDVVGGSLALRVGFEKRPVVLVSWIGARRFCGAQGKRLPSEPEWEAAARGGGRAEFPWGDMVPSCEDVAFGGSVGKRCSIVAPRDVGASSRDLTHTGVHDLGGNVMEWVDGPGEGSDSHPIRGGSWAGSAFEARSARRRFGKSGEMLGDLGFRCARDVAR
jgi:formylglycine-generating enzyme required for sulfatase activity